MSLNALTQIQAAALLSIAPRTLRDWVDCPRNADGSYPGPALVAYYVAKLGGGGEYDNQRERLAAAQAEKVETENRVRRGELCEAQAVASLWADILGTVRQKLLGTPNKLGPQLVNINDPAAIVGIIRQEVVAILDELSSDTGPLSRGDETAADVDRESMGRREPETV